MHPRSTEVQNDHVPTRKWNMRYVLPWEGFERCSCFTFQFVSRMSMKKYIVPNHLRPRGPGFRHRYMILVTNDKKKKPLFIMKGRVVHMLSLQYFKSLRCVCLTKRHAEDKLYLTFISFNLIHSQPQMLCLRRQKSFMTVICSIPQNSYEKLSVV